MFPCERANNITTETLQREIKQDVRLHVLSPLIN